MTAHILIEIITLTARSSSRFSGLTVFLVDQAMHIASLVVLVWLASPKLEIEHITTFGFKLEPELIALACAYIAVTFMGAIIIFEVSNSFGPDKWNKNILLYDRSRILGMIERASALLLSVWLGVAFVLIPFIPRLFKSWKEEGDERSRQIMVFLSGLIICVAGWAFVVYSASEVASGTWP